MDVSQWQARIDAIPWYHEFDFGNGLRAQCNTPDAGSHRLLWQFIEKQLDAIDFHGKTVLDIGCWDGYWSFYAERRGAKRVLATDDRTQNWAGGEGIYLAKELLRSSVAINQDLSIYDLASLNEKFDIVLMLGVYYHLLDPLYGFAQIRHCCHANSLLMIEGDAATALPQNAAMFEFAQHSCEFLPTRGALQQILGATYFTEVRHIFQDEPVSLGEDSPSSSDNHKGHSSRLGWRWRLRMCQQALAGSGSGVKEMMRFIEDPAEQHKPADPRTHRRMFLTCVPLNGLNEIHCYKPPFGLHLYDSRFCDSGGK
jgi:tRNA (mo5U34)-methyltransferase